MRNHRGGRRRGAGAPEGNLNALKHGRRSRQLRQIYTAAARPGARRLIGKVLIAALLTAAGVVVDKKRRLPLRDGDARDPEGTNTHDHPDQSPP